MDKQRENLIELINNVQDRGTKTEHEKNSTWILSPSNEKLADYLLANGVIVPPCKVGDVIYVISPLRGLEEKIVTGIEQSSTKTLYIRSFGSAHPNYLIGKTVFLSREDAEKALENKQ